MNRVPSNRGQRAETGGIGTNGYRSPSVRPKGRMSALGHKRTFYVAVRESALPPKADMDAATQNVRLVPIADICVQRTKKTAARQYEGKEGPLPSTSLPVLRGA